MELSTDNRDKGKETSAVSNPLYDYVSPALSKSYHHETIKQDGEVIATARAEVRRTIWFACSGQDDAGPEFKSMLLSKLVSVAGDGSVESVGLRKAVFLSKASHHWAVVLNSEDSKSAVLKKQVEVAGKQLVPRSDTRTDIAYRITGISESTTFSEVTQAFIQYGKVLTIDGTEAKRENRKNRLLPGIHHVTVLPHTPEPLPALFTLMIHDNTVEAARIYKPNVQSDIDTEDEVEQEYFSASGGEEPVMLETGSSLASIGELHDEKMMSSNTDDHGKDLKGPKSPQSPQKEKENSKSLSVSGTKSPKSPRKEPHIVTNPILVHSETENELIEKPQERADRIAKELINSELEAENEKMSKIEKKQRKRSKKRTPEEGSHHTNNMNELQNRIHKLEAELLAEQEKAKEMATKSAEKIDALESKNRGLEAKLALFGSRKKELEVNLSALRRQFSNYRKQVSVPKKSGTSENEKEELKEEDLVENEYETPHTNKENNERSQTDAQLQDLAQRNNDLMAFRHRQMQLATMSLNALNSFRAASLNASRATGGLPVASSCVWAGQGSPYLLHLEYATHVILPHAVSLLLQEFGNGGIMLVGASAWGAYFKPMLDTEDMDFVVMKDNPNIEKALEGVRTKLSLFQEVRRELAVLEAISSVGRWSHVAGKDGYAAYQERVITAEATMPVDGRDYGRSLVVEPNDKGFRLRLGHRALLDLSESDSASREFSFAPLSAMLPTSLLYTTDMSSELMVPVASPIVLTRHLELSLSSASPWRIKKDLTRLRLISHSVWVQTIIDPLHPSTALLAHALPHLQQIVARLDPQWFAVLNGMQAMNLTHEHWIRETTNPSPS
eukprot:m.75341 g.75341  ORF g.75341 m.75341 type:complete len:844 (+) comp12494_c0_seq1:437-2968(+)